MPVEDYLVLRRGDPPTEVAHGPWWGPWIAQWRKGAEQQEASAVAPCFLILDAP